MLAQPTKLCNFSPEYLAAARFYEYHQHSPTTAIALTPPYEHKYNFVPIYTNSPPKVFDDFDKYGRAFTPLSLSSSSSSSPSDLQLRAMQLPLTPPLSNTPPPQLASVSPPVFWPSNYGLSEVAKPPPPPPNMDVQRTHSVIMKVEDQRIVEIPARELNHRPSSSESEDEIIVCKWRKCYRHFEMLDNLASHVTATHAVASATGLYYCLWENCARSERGFNARYKMLVHVRTHTKEKPHHCGQCPKSFSRAENLKIHIRSHSGEKPYQCPVEGCNKAYSNSSDRFKHTRTHSTEKPYVCKFPSCNKRYTDPSSLRKHVKTFKHVAVPVIADGESVKLPSPPSAIHIETKTENNNNRSTIKRGADAVVAAAASKQSMYSWSPPPPSHYRCDCSSSTSSSSLCPERYQTSPRPRDLYNLNQMFGKEAAPQRYAYHRNGVDDEHSSSADYWIEQKIHVVDVDDSMEMESDSPLDLSVPKGFS